MTISGTLRHLQHAIKTEAQQNPYERGPIYRLSNADLEGLPDEERELCYDYALHFHHPMIYPPSTKPQAPYTLNFLWVNLNPQDRATHIAQNIFGLGLDERENHPLENDEETQKTFMYKLRTWVELNPDATINLWYDSALVTEKARENTLIALQTIHEVTHTTLVLRDVRLLSNIPPELLPTLHPGTPVYYRVDLLKILIADSYFGCSKIKYAVISDIDVRPMPAKQLFDRTTLLYLDTKGYVFTNVGMFDMENSFMAINTTAVKVREQLKTSVLDDLIDTFSSLRKYPIGASLMDSVVPRSSSVFQRLERFCENMGEAWKMKNKPRKVAMCPPSSFNAGGYFKDTDHQKESFRFIGLDNIPYTFYGRAYRHRREIQLPELLHWQCKPLAPIETIAPVEPTPLEVLYDTGFHGWLEVRGEGLGLSWDKGIRMEWHEGNQWRAPVLLPLNAPFKIYMHKADGTEAFEIGENRTSVEGPIIPLFE